MITREQIEKVFSPGMFIEDPHYFVGRKSLVRKGINALHRKGNDIVVTGLRGVGKTSLAYQLGKLAEGDNSLIEAMRLWHDIPYEKFNYVTHMCKCNRSIHSIPVLLLEILRGDGDKKSLYAISGLPDPFDSDYKFTREGGFETETKIVKASYQNISEIKKRLPDAGSHNEMVREFRKVINTIQRKKPNSQGLLVILDEFDMTSQKLLVGELIKPLVEYDQGYIKFMLVGIANNTQELIGDHASMPRSCASLRLGPMDDADMISILANAEYRTNRQLVFHDDAKNEIIEVADGFPHFAHLLGVESAILAFDELLSTKKKYVDKVVVTQSHAKQAIKALSNGELVTTYEDTFKSIGQLDEHRKDNYFILKSIVDIKKKILTIKELERRITLPPGISAKQIKGIVGLLVSNGVYKYISANKDKISLINPGFSIYIKRRVVDDLSYQRHHWWG